MSDTTKDQGLPAWLFAPRFAVITGVGIAVVFSLVVSIFAGLSNFWDDVNAAAPDCFLLNAKPHEPGKRSFDREDREGISARGGRRVTLEALLDAGATCTPESCPSRAQAAYQKAAKAYVVTRALSATHLDVKFGYFGLNFAREIYDTPDDERAVTELRERYRSGRVDLDAFQNYKAPTRMLLFKPAEEFQHCRLVG